MSPLMMSEALETRALMANVFAGLDPAGQLIVNGTSASDRVEITTDATHLYVRSGGAGTTVNGGANFSAPKFSISALFGNLGDGNDSVRMDRVDQGLSGSLATGKGSDSIWISNSILAAFSVQTGDDSDAVVLSGGAVQNTVLDTGAGSDVLTTIGATVFNRCFITMGSGNDLVVVAKTTVFGFTRIDGGSGLDAVLGLSNNLQGGSAINEFEFRYNI